MSQAGCLCFGSGLMVLTFPCSQPAPAGQSRRLNFPLWGSTGAGTGPGPARLRGAFPKPCSSSGEHSRAGGTFSTHGPGGFWVFQHRAQLPPSSAPKDTNAAQRVQHHPCLPNKPSLNSLLRQAGKWQAQQTHIYVLYIYNIFYQRCIINFAVVYFTSCLL